MGQKTRQIVCRVVEVTGGGEGKGTSGGGGVRVGVLLVLDGDEATELGREGLKFPQLRRWGQARLPAVRRAVVLLPPPLPLPWHLLFLRRRRCRRTHVGSFQPLCAR
jgi:hypothetical protein